MRPEFVQELKSALEATDPKDDTAFQRIISTIISEGLFVKEELADILLQSIPTIDRWSRGKNLPSPYVRKGILRWLKIELYQKFPSI